MYIKKLAIALLPLVLAGCSQKFNDVNDTMKLALFGEPDAVKSHEDIQYLPYASIYAKVNDGPQAFMVLALAEPIISGTLGNHSNTASESQPMQLKWLSADKAMLVTEHGRIVKTLNMAQGNLVASTSNTKDPLSMGLHNATTPMHWQRTVDWQPGYHFGYQLDSVFKRQGEQVILINEQPVTALYVTESVTVETLALSYDNEFWIDATNGRVLKTKQKIAPTLPYIELTVLKPFA